MYKLVRDNIPELMKKSDIVCNHAIIQNDELYVAFLKEKLIEEVNEFLSCKGNDNPIAELADIICVVHALYTLAGISDDEFKNIYMSKVESNGDFTKRIIMFMPDTPTDNEVK